MHLTRMAAILIVGFGVSTFAFEATADAKKRHKVGNECHKTSESDIAALFERWNDSLKTGDPKKVVDNYAEHSLLLPTVSNKPRFTAEEKVDYFEHFLKNGPSGVIDAKHRMIDIDCNSALDAGLYTFTFANGTTVDARYTFTYKWNGKEWLITSHHSSKMPEQPASAATH